MEKLCQQYHLLMDEHGIIRVPFLVKGRLVLSPEMSREEIEWAFSQVSQDIHYLRLAHAQLLREPVIDRSTLKYTGEYLYQVLPPVNPIELVESDIDKLVRGPYSLTTQEILQYLQTVSNVLQENWATVERVRQLCQRTTEHPDVYLDAAFAALQFGLDPQAAQCMIDNELSIWQIPGSKFLDGWVEIPSDVLPGLAPLLAQTLPGHGIASQEAQTRIRGMPTRQLHITAGNAPQIPIVSALRVVLTKSAGVIKSPHETTLPGALLALAAVTAAPEHPLTQNLSVVYWHGGDNNIETTLFMPNAFDRIVVWGAPDAVTSVQSRAVFTKTICFNPRYGISMIGKEAFSDSLDQVAFAAATDVMIYSQKACTASQAQYVEGTVEQVEAYAVRLREILARWDELAPPFILPAIRGQLKRMKRGKYSRAQWLANTKEGEFTSGVLVMPDEFDILDHPMCRLVIIRRVNNLKDALKYLHHGVSTVGVYPEARRFELVDLIAARGVSNVLPLGQCERVFSGAPQDGMMVLSQLVDWKNA
jgi:hypothetical protein